ncbi:MAG TPA: non-canonical purine NTP pyrophosphatase, RdgB/HAM1 family [Deltaproteobacteria bacterium]|nr:MAG: non-canonical purine NTP pyrophosphatase, RdgB/HAM1 family [Deltaproteobacteria bacterium GWA2_55_82]OGQ63665.1 MAG: non-canonical purine NTP pyrophosphatase, RdgB/HAM1 family [Deltaproteobacteria bacterium RIFCSPLOWO2_02_FULL_55_12]OIJ75141.1 MAG: non-canonical purine NTP pyrophosphatase, RdgB/HAM1 family [Deltaproteobacteria bacterium GWC2_55_46]HBG47143.1 non-canonical purine NTP pyrophosphatase, RdgB/HAM1 family [Deltaproteobacteria bacterium]HCY10796.1 non-canonical purine NTP pyro
MRIVLATKNAGKAREISSILEGAGVELVTLAEYPELELPPETGETFRENALAKARFTSAATGLPALADDSGLEVDALGGRPGVRSARYAGAGATDRENYEKLLAEMKGVPMESRGARFRCAVAFVGPGGPGGIEELFEGSFSGSISEEPRGRGGFGYDPVFIVPGRGITVAELPPGEKDRLSHRAKALEAFKVFLIGRKREKKS